MRLELDVPLARVRELLAAPGDAERAALLDAERSRLAAEVARRQAALRTLERLASGPRAVRYDVRVAARRSQRLHALAAVVEAEKIGPGTAAACERFAEIAVRAGLRSGPFVAVFPLDLTPVVAVRVGLPGDGPPSLELEEVVLPGGEWASTVHVGSYDELPLAYAALLEHVRELGHSARGPVCETYLADPDGTPEDQLVTAVAVAVEGSMSS